MNRHERMYCHVEKNRISVNVGYQFPVWITWTCTFHIPQCPDFFFQLRSILVMSLALLPSIFIDETRALEIPELGISKVISTL